MIDFPLYELLEEEMLEEVMNLAFINEANELNEELEDDTNEFI